MVPQSTSHPAVPGTTECDFLADALRAEADAIGRIADRAAQDTDAWTAALDLLEPCRGCVVVAGMGKSGLVGQKIAATLASLGQPSHFVHPAEAVHGDLGKIRRDDVVMLLSYSGNTDEVVNLAAILRADNIPTLGISRDHQTPLADLCAAHLAVGDIAEACPLNLAPTASTTAQLAIGDALALALSRRRSFTADDFHKHHPGGMLGVGLRKVTEALRFKAGENLAVVSDTHTLRAALEESRAMARDGRRAGAVVLVDGGGILSGIFTDGDLRRLVIEAGPELERTLDQPVAKVMTARPQHLTTEDLVRDAVRLIRERRLDEIPVVDQGGKPVGLVDVQDLIAMKVVSE